MMEVLMPQMRVDLSYIFSEMGLAPLGRLILGMPLTHVIASLLGQSQPDMAVGGQMGNGQPNSGVVRDNVAANLSDALRCGANSRELQLTTLRSCAQIRSLPTGIHTVSSSWH